MAPTIERVTEACILGEAPHWDVATQTLYYVDIPGKKILRYTPSTKKFAKASAGDKQATFIIPVAGKKDHFVISLNNDLVIISWDGESDKFAIVETLTNVTPSDAVKWAFNDGKCDSSGRLWAGTQNINLEDVPKTPAVGTLYSFDAKNRLKSHKDNIKVANGLAFNDQLKKMYYIDSLTMGIDQYDFDINTGTISNGKVLFTLPNHDIPGIPDGMAIDTDGNLWVAVFGGSRVIKIHGTKPETLIQTIQMPTLQVTSVAFGGPNLDELYVTTAGLEQGGVKLPPPVNGATYRITGTGSKGLPAPSFKL